MSVTYAKIYGFAMIGKISRNLIPGLGKSSYILVSAIIFLVLSSYSFFIYLIINL